MRETARVCGIRGSQTRPGWTLPTRCVIGTQGLIAYAEVKPVLVLSPLKDKVAAD